jgi:hypothetical protein
MRVMHGMCGDTLDAFASSVELDWLLVLCDFFRLFFFYIWCKGRIKDVGIIETTQSILTGGEGL